MKTLLFLALVVFAALTTHAQRDPFFAKLIEIKTSAEYKLEAIFKKQELEIATISDEPRGIKQREQTFANYTSNIKCVSAYEQLRQKVDKIVAQLKADLTMSNRLKALKALNQNVETKNNGWYGEAIKEVDANYKDLMDCDQNELKPASIGDITGINTSLP